MRTVLLALGATLACGVLVPPARAVPVPPAPAVEPSPGIVQVDRRCGAHNHYIRSHYNRAGTLVRGHCAPNRPRI